MSTFYDEIRETATRLNLEIGNHYSDLYIESHPEILEIAAKHGKAKRNSVSNVQLSQGIHFSGYSGLDRFTCQITGKPMIDFPFAFAPYWDARARSAMTPATLTPENSKCTK